MIKRTILKISLMFCILCLVWSFDLPKAWFVAGSKPQNYDMGIDQQEGRNGKNVATIKSKSKKSRRGFGTLMQQCAPGKFLGKRVRMSGLMKSKDVRRWAGFWFRVDKRSGGPLSFDNMHGRAIKGSTDWMRYEIVLDVPLHATNLAYGALLVGGGQIWFDDINFEVVTNAVSTTNDSNLTMPLDEPSNLDFEQ
jgi:hypothetical protein